MSCRICCGGTNAAVCCPSCQEECCRSCFQTYLMTSGSTDADCMYCHKVLSIDFLYDNTEPRWLTGVYSERLRVTLFDREFAQMPADQERVAAFIEARNWLRQNKAENDTYKLKQRRYYYKTIVTNYGVNPATAPATAPTAPATAGASKKRTPTFIKACIMSGCKGFLDKSLTCGLCAAKVCFSCHERRLGGHKCDKDVVASVSAIKAEARPCPSCSALISKIDGCDQMWCTQCHVTFSWLSGLRETGVTHNPHYYAWARLNGGLAPVAQATVPTAQQCNTFPTLAEIVAVCKDPVIIEYHRYLVHIKSTVLFWLLGTNDDTVHLRVLYMAGDHNKRSFCDCLLDSFIRAQQRRRRRQVYEMVCAAGGDLLRGLSVEAEAAKAATALKQLLAYGDECLRKLSDQYGTDCGSLCPSIENAGV